MGLSTYRRKRRFEQTPEPRGRAQSVAGHAFVVQKHAAHRLHYDFRLELDGVLKSWAVPKGPCLDPSVKRLAIEVEDHPVEYGDFEGVIPAGEYGGGTVMLWDHGDWEPLGDPHAAYRSGQLKFRLHGQKLRGGWALIRLRDRMAQDNGKNQWILIKERDVEAKSLNDGDVLEEMPLSIASDRDMDQIAEDRDRVWGESARPGSPPVAAARSSAAAVVMNRTGVKSAMPERIDVELATRADKAPPGEDWFHEIKFDGYRIVARLDRGHVQLLSRNHKDWTARFPDLAASISKLPVRQAVFDGEVVVVNSQGISDFQLLQNIEADGAERPAHYYIFDLLYFDGMNLMPSPLHERKRQLSDILARHNLANIHLSEHVQGHGSAFLRAARKKGLEGIVSKRRNSAYGPGRGLDWLKIKCIQSGEFIVGGYTDPAGARLGLGALLLGQRDSRGQLKYAGKVGTGFDDASLVKLAHQLEVLERNASPFEDLDRAPRGTHWVTPNLVAQVAYGSRTHEGILRHSAFLGLREDKEEREVEHEATLPLAKILNASKGRQKSNSRSEPALPTTNELFDAAKQQFAGVRFTHPDKVLYPEQGITKLELAEYFFKVADWMLPHVADRPLVLMRCPNGPHKGCFYQKHPGAGSPEELRQVPIKEKSKTENYALVNDVQGLVALAQLGALEVHAWGCRADKVELPDRLIFDLDPDPSVSWDMVVDSAHMVRQFLGDLGLESFVKTTGGKGLHVVVPIQRRHAWEETRTFCKQVADLIQRADPKRYTTNMAKAARPGKIFLDYLRNGRGATAIVPYSTRARPGAPVATPLAWRELGSNLRSDQFTIRNVLNRLGSLSHDPWQGMASLRQSLTRPMTKVAHFYLG